ncbi:IS1 family transposase [Skermanella aerolata]
MADLLGTTAPSVLRWVCRYVDRFCTRPPPGEAVVIELDKMWHFQQHNDNKVCIWKAYDRATGRLVDWECGARDERAFRRLFERLAHWKVRLFCSDNYVVYPLVLAVGGHYQGNGETVGLERNNGQQRHWTVTLRRRSIVVSRPLAMSLAHPKDALPTRQRRLLPPRKGSSVVSLYSPTSTSTRMLLPRCTGCQSDLADSSRLPKMQHYSVKPSP